MHEKKLQALTLYYFVYYNIEVSFQFSLGEGGQHGKRSSQAEAL